uniref:Uncharacterized protein n=1 Tax=Eptatretus burgeri TaxID=7764 RepID=A0A8C4QP14_EPTBU
MITLNPVLQLHEQFRKLSGFNDVSVSPSNEGTISDYPVKTKFHYNNDNINKIYNGRLKNEIAKTFEAQVRANQGKMILKGSISQQNVPRENLDLVLHCNTSYEGYIVSFNSTGAFCISPCNDASYCNNHGTCSHLVSGPKCSCDPVCVDQQKCTGCKPPESNLFKILFGTLGGLLGVGILLGIVCYCVKHPYPSKSVQPPDENG